MAKDLSNLQQTWDALGSSAPLWAVLSRVGEGDADWDLDEFMATGVAQIDELLQFLQARDLLPSMTSALDFGCGPGRLSQALAAHFDRVIGVDIAPSMVAVADRLNRCGERVRYMVIDSGDLRPLASSEFDLAYSAITLQHMRPRLATTYVRELIRVLAPGGVLVFQLPSRLTVRGQMDRAVAYGRAIASAIRRQRHGESAPAIHFDMFGIRRSRVERIIRNSGGRLEAIVRDEAAGPGWVSHTYFIRRVSAASE